MLQLNNTDTWRSKAGYLPVHLNKCEELEKYIMLDGGYYDFCLDLTGSDRKRDDIFADSWSTNSKSYVCVNQNDVLIYNWTKNQVSKLPIERVENNFDTFVKILNELSVRTEFDLVPVMLSYFRKIRNVMGKNANPLEVLRQFYSFLFSIDNNIPTKDYYPKMDLHLSDSLEPFVEQMLEVNPTKPHVDLILRHCSGPLFQEIHREVEFFDAQLDLFDGVSSKLKYKGKYCNSIHYTPQFVARSLVENALSRLDLTKDKLRIIDPACGSGSFLVEILKQLKELNYRGKIELTGWDCSEGAISTTQLLLQYEKCTQWTDNFEYIVKQTEDSLQENWNADYDIVVMNPPYVSWEQLKDSAAKQAVLQSLEGITLKKRPNQAAAFLWKAGRSLASEGVLSVIVPSALLLQEQYNDLRNKLQEFCTIEVVGRLGNYVFEDALTDASILVLKKKQTDVQHPKLIWCANQNGASYQALKELRKMNAQQWDSLQQEQCSIYTPYSFPLQKETWNVVSKADYELYLKMVQKLSSGLLKPLNAVFVMKQGLLPGVRHAFDISLSEYSQLSAIEKKYYRPLASADTIQNGKVMLQRYIWYPYDEKGLLIVDEEKFKENLPYSWKLLSKHKEKLEKRSEGKFWWELTRPRNWQYEAAAINLYSKRFGNSKSFAVSKHGCVVQDGNDFTFRSSNYTEEDYYFYLSVFSSSTFEKLLSIYSRRILSGYDLGQISIKDIPLIDKAQIFGYQMESYDKLVKFGKAMSEGRLFSQSAIDECVLALYGI